MSRKNKNIINAVLIIFIVASAAYLVADQIFSKPQPAPVQSPSSQPAQPPQAQSQPDQPESTQPAPQPAEKLADSKIIVCYFYGDVRCPTCRKFETYTKQALDEAFADELADGRIEYRLVNVDRNENKHYINDYQLYTKTIIIAESKDQQQLRWKNLEKIWKLVGNKPKFFDYIQTQVHDYLGAQSL